MKKVVAGFCSVVIFLALFLVAVQPQKWELRNISDYLKGKFEGISVTYDGVLSLSPKVIEMEGPTEEFFLSLLVSQGGTVYLGTGHDGKIYRRNEAGQFELYFKVPEQDIFCLAQDSKGNLYAGSSPNGKIYKITSQGKGEPFFNPQERYIWDLKFDEKEILLAAVGESGGIYAINQRGEGQKFLDSEENHILCLEMNRNGGWYAGSGGKGRLYRISPQRRATILYESPFEEIRTITLDRVGNIYAAAGGKSTKPISEPKPAVSAKPDAEVSITVTPSGTISQDMPSKIEKQPGALFKVNSEGIAKRLWSSSDEMIYSLFWNEVGQELIFGTGNQGRVYSIDSNEKVSLMVQKQAEQIYLLQPHGTGIYTLSNNPSNVCIISAEQRFEGEYTSRVFDAKTLASWGRIEWDAEMPSGTTLQFQTRSGNSSEPNQTWSDWSPPYQKIEGEQMLNPKARYLQFKVNFKSQSGKISPQLQKISLFYLQSNLAPIISRVELLPANVVFLKLPDQKEQIQGAEQDITEQAKNNEKTMGYVVSKKAERKGYQTIVWDAVDENGDVLVYSVSIRNENENQWRTLKQDWGEKVFAFDTLSFPDGIYFIKIDASDRPSNPLGMELKSEKISRPLMIDNSLPVIQNLQVARERNQ
ncbi:MAG: WD40 repeat domain-containing protein, partial [Candidatus Aminicenantes bacterium]